MPSSTSPGSFSVGPIFNPLQVGLKPGSNPYMGGPISQKPQAGSNPSSPAQQGGITQKPGAQSLGAQGILATGNGPGGAAYGQNLASYAGGQFMRPQGGLQFNPFNISQTQFGSPVGGGNAPSIGMPNTLLGQAQGGQPFAPTPPATANTNMAASPQGHFSIEQLFATPAMGGVNNGG